MSAILSNKNNGGGENSMRNYIVLIMLILLTACANTGYNTSNADMITQQILLGYSAQMLAPAHSNYPMYAMFPGGYMMYTPAYGDQAGVICNTFGMQTFCTGY